MKEIYKGNEQRLYFSLHRNFVFSASSSSQLKRKTMSWTSISVFNVLVLIFFVSFLSNVKGDIKFCFTGDYQVIVSNQSAEDLTSYNCPAGLLFKDPVELSAARKFRKSGFCVNKNICESDHTICGKDEHIFQAQFLIGNFTLNENFEIFEETNDDLSTNGTPCLQDLEDDELESENSVVDEKGNSVLVRKKRTTPGETLILSNDTITQDIIDETRLLFYFLARINDEDVKSKHRVVQLLGPSIEVVKRRCDPTRLDPMFMDTIHEAMLFLIKQEGTSKLEDITAEEATLMTEALKRCSRGTHPIKVHGPECLSQINYVSHKKNGQEGVLNYIFDEKYNFKWGMYDPVVDALWLTVDIIHGLCHHEFAKVDLQHKYLTTLTEIFMMKRIMDRWSRPTPLMRQETYDSIFLAPMNQSLNILDACNVGAYIHSPYPHRTLREINSRKRRNYRKKLREEAEKGAGKGSEKTMATGPPPSRKRRAVHVPHEYRRTQKPKYDPSSLDWNMDQEAYCLQTPEERDEKINQLRMSKCSRKK